MGLSISTIKESQGCSSAIVWLAWFASKVPIKAGPCPVAMVDPFEVAILCGEQDAR